MKTGRNKAIPLDIAFAGLLAHADSRQQQSPGTNVLH